ncbi:MAG: SsrA-binding protein SmpB [Patescibacteria group bacterium]
MKIFNKRARFDYKILDKIEAGIVLSGGEARAVRTGHLNLTNSFAKILGSEVYLVNANIPVPGKKDYSPTRSRKLLLHRSEIVSTATKLKAKKLTLVPISMYTTHGLIKVELGLGKSKKKFEKKELLKKKDIQRDIDRELK